MNSVLAHAQRYVKQGWSVIPIKPNTKEAVVKWNTYRDRLATQHEINEWFGDGVKNNVGIVTGKLSNISVLDADGTDGVQELVQRHLSSVGTVITGANGKQLYFKHNGESNYVGSVNHQGLDIKGEGGYVVAPPSVHPNGKTYRWASGRVPHGGTLSTFPALSLSKPQEGGTLLDGTVPGRRHYKLVKLACYLLPRHAYSITQKMMLEWNDKNLPPLPQEEVLKQLHDLSVRFNKGLYTSRFVPPKEIALSTPDADVDAYINAVVDPMNAALPELPTGYGCLDEVTWGLRRGDITTVGARPGTGKTTFVINVAAHLCGMGKRVLFFSTEMSKSEVYNALFASQASIDAFELSNKQLSTGDKGRLIGFIPTFRSYDIHLANTFRPDINEVHKATALVKPDVLIFDHIQHIGNGDQQYHQIDVFTKALKQLAIDNNIAVLVASQLHRGAVTDGNVPELHHLKGCGTIEEESSVVMIMHDQQKKDNRPILFRIAKNRHGKCGDTTLLFEARTVKFRDMAIKVC